MWKAPHSAFTSLSCLFHASFMRPRYTEVAVKIRKPNAKLITENTMMCLQTPHSSSGATSDWCNNVLIWWLACWREADSDDVRYRTRSSQASVWFRIQKFRNQLGFRASRKTDTLINIASSSTAVFSSMNQQSAPVCVRVCVWPFTWVMTHLFCQSATWSVLCKLKRERGREDWLDVTV